jgi:hypothetical protein
MFNEWIKSDKTIAGFPALKHRVTGELAAHGSKGQLYEAAPGKLVAIEYLPSGEERLIDVKDVQAMAKRLDISFNLDKQLRVAGYL